ncbi:MAG TPA: alpha/beta fold hydrolase [Solirubrobacteraceae bacterium]|nr:alpha/beta fold hydrolase [Solirubrobacteraceae bacterium]
MSRLDVTFPSGGLRCAGWLHLPDGDGPSPCVVLAHGFAGTRHDAIDPYADRFAEAGLAALVFDYRHFGDSEGMPRQLLDVGLQHEDYRAAVAYARSRPEVDPSRIALWGTSFSGGHVVHLAARDPSIAAAIAQTPMVDGRLQILRFPRRAAVRVTGRALRDQLAALRRRPPVTMPVRGRPGDAAALTSPSSYEGYAALLGPESRWRDDVAARMFLRVGLYRPIADAPRVTCPLLVCVGDEDDLTPPEPAVRVAELAPRGEVRRYPTGHWGVYPVAGGVFEQVVADQAEFLRRHLREEAR